MMIKNIMILLIFFFLTKIIKLLKIAYFHIIFIKYKSI